MPRSPFPEEVETCLSGEGVFNLIPALSRMLNLMAQIACFYFMILQTVYLGAMSGNLAFTCSSVSTIASEIFSNFIKFGAGIFPRIHLESLRLNTRKFALYN